MYVHHDDFPLEVVFDCCGNTQRVTTYPTTAIIRCPVCRKIMADYGWKEPEEPLFDEG